MSVDYYLSNRKKREEIQSFNEFWENHLVPELKNRIMDYCDEVDGDHVNSDFAKQVIDDRVSSFSYAPGDTTSYETLIGSSRWNGRRTLFQWDGAYVDGRVISDELSIIEFFSNKEHQIQYCIIDEYNKEYTLNEFLDKIKSKDES